MRRIKRIEQLEMDLRDLKIEYGRKIDVLNSKVHRIKQPNKYKVNDIVGCLVITSCYTNYYNVIDINGNTKELTECELNAIKELEKLKK